MNSGNGRFKVLYRQDQLPVFQNRMYDTEAEAKACPKGDVLLVEDLKTGLVYNSLFNPDLMKYDEHYQNEQALSPYFQEHLEQVAAVIEKCMGREGMVEVGCGKAYFLELLQQKGFDVIGFDPAYEGNNPKVKRHYFRPELNIHANGLVLRHVLEHIQDPFHFLTQLKTANGGEGRIYIEVPCFDWICTHRAWFDIFYEHVNYFRLSDFYRMFDRVVESGRLFGGQYLYVVAELASLREPEIDFDDLVSFPTDFSKKIKGDLEVTGQSAIWGGSSKGVIFALLKSREGHSISTVIDINPAKQGKYLPSTGLRVQSPTEALATLPNNSTIYVMNSNYLQEIKEMSNNAFRYVGVDHE